MRRLQRGHRFANQIGHCVRYAYWCLFRPRTHGVQIIAARENQILLVRHSYMDRTLWALPGGGIQKGESALAGARRELKEELSIDGDFRELGNVDLYHDFHTDLVRVFLVTVRNDVFQLDETEISEARWFETDRLPQNMTTLTNHVLITRSFIAAKVSASPIGS